MQIRSRHPLRFSSRVAVGWPRPCRMLHRVVDRNINGQIKAGDSVSLSISARLPGEKRDGKWVGLSAKMQLEIGYMSGASEVIIVSVPLRFAAADSSGTHKADHHALFEADGFTHRPMPTRTDLLEMLSENPDAKNLALVESRFVTGSAKRLGQATNVDLENPFVVIDTSEIGKDLLAAGTFTATDFCTEKCKESRVKKKALILDELWALIGASSNP